jgi:hypothetical protein
MKKPLSQIKKILLWSIPLGIAGILMSIYAVSLVIEDSVRQKCVRAQEFYAGDCVAALSSVLVDEDKSFREKNDAIWTLGQLGDDRALPLLEPMYTGEINKTKYDADISQYELMKAVKLIRGGFNVTHYFRSDI